MRGGVEEDTAKTLRRGKFEVLCSKFFGSRFLDFTFLSVYIILRSTFYNKEFAECPIL